MQSETVVCGCITNKEGLTFNLKMLFIIEVFFLLKKVFFELLLYRKWRHFPEKTQKTQT